MVFEATLISCGTFSFDLQDGLLTLGIILQRLPSLAELEWYAFVPARGIGSMTQHDRIFPELDDVIHLQPDPMQ